MNNSIKIYMPFNALKGYEESLVEASIKKEKKKVLLDDREEVINNIILNLKVNDFIKIIYYNRNCYNLKRGLISKLMFNKGYLLIENTKICFKDIYDIEVI